MWAPGSSGPFSESRESAEPTGYAHRGVAGEGRFAALVPGLVGLEVRAELRLKAVGSRTAPTPGPQTGVLTPSTDRTWPSRMTEETYLLYLSPRHRGPSPLKTPSRRVPVTFDHTPQGSVARPSGHLRRQSPGALQGKVLTRGPRAAVNKGSPRPELCVPPATGVPSSVLCSLSVGDPWSFLGEIPNRAPYTEARERLRKEAPPPWGPLLFQAGNSQSGLSWATSGCGAPRAGLQGSSKFV